MDPLHRLLFSTRHKRRSRRIPDRQSIKPKWVQFRHYPKEILMAMEMSLFESEERRALEGELERLEEAWREAEELAAISDNLIEPKGWTAFRAAAKSAREGGPPGL